MGWQCSELGQIFPPLLGFLCKTPPQTHQEVFHNDSNSSQAVHEDQQKLYLSKINTLTKSRKHVAEHGIVKIRWVADEKRKEHSQRVYLGFKELFMHVRNFDLIISVLDGHCELINKSDCHVWCLLGNLITSPNYHF